MKKSKAKYVMQCDSHPIHQTTNLCIFMENEELVDLTVICDTFSVRVHKCVLGANSAYFLDHLQRDMNIDRVVIQGIKQNVVKALIEFMYCGETSVLDEDMDELVAAAKFFGIRAISALVPDSLGSHPKSNQGSKSKLECRPPQFLKKNQNHNRRRKNKNPITMYHELVSHTATTNDETRKYITIKNQLLFDDALPQPPRETCEQTVYDAPDNIDLKFESLELVEINSSIKDELHEFLNIVNEEETTYQQVTNASGLEPIIYTADVPDYMAINFQDSNVTQYSAEQNEHVYLLEAAKTLTATPVTYNKLEVDTVTEYKLDAATGEYVVQHEQDNVAGSSTQFQHDTVAGAESSIQLEQDTVAGSSAQLEQGSVARARSSPKLEHDIVAGSPTQLEHAELSAQFEQVAVVGAGSSTQLEHAELASQFKQDAVVGAGSSTQLEYAELAAQFEQDAVVGAGSLTQLEHAELAAQLEQDAVVGAGSLTQLEHAELAAQFEQDAVVGAGSSTQLEHAELAAQFEQDAVVGAGSSTQLEHAELAAQFEQDAVVGAGSLIQLEHAELAAQFKQDAVVGAGSLTQHKQDTVTESSTELEQDTLAKPATQLEQDTIAGAGSLTQLKQQDTPSTQLEQDFVDNYEESDIDNTHNDAESLNLIFKNNSKRAKNLKNKLKYD